MATESKEENIEHSFIDLDEKEQKEQKLLEQNKPSVNATAIVVIGRTGAGKSSLINLFCSAAKIGHGINSQTTGCHVYKESNMRYFLDSQGASDSNNTPDEQVLRDILKALYEANISKIKIIWCVSGDTQARAAQEFKKQAKFIKNTLGDNSTSIWQSCLIIKKKGTASPSNGLDGLLAASAAYDCSIKYGDARLFGYSFYDANTADNTVIQALKYITDPSARAQFLKGAGFWSKDDIKNALNKLLSGLPDFSISFTVKKCSKCNSKGDPRFVYAKCHTASQKHHPQDLIKFHPEERVKYHPAKTPQKYHPKNLIAFHPENKVKYHPAKTPQKYHPKLITKYHSGHVEKRWHHPGYKKSYYYHPKGSYWNLFKNNSTAWRYKCCDKWNYLKNDGYEKDNGCTFNYDKWTCCGYSGSSGPCTSYYSYSCCGGSKSSDGCKTGFGCCYRDTTDRGCKEEYSCCNGSIDSQGCEEKYSCCKAAGGNKGCEMKYECCEKSEADKGCKEEYRCCNKSVDDKGCEEKYTCCEAPGANEGCEMKYECCEKPETDEGCEERCSNASCHVKWGTGPGCIDVQTDK